MAAEDLGLLTSWYERLESFIKNKNLRPRDIYNFDKSGFRIGEGKTQKVILSCTTSYVATGGPGENIMAIECIAADGWLMPPWFLVQGKNHMENWYRTTNLPSDYTLVPTPTGWITDTAAFQWIHAFHECTKNRVSRGGFRLLLMDNHGSHLTPSSYNSVTAIVSLPTALSLIRPIYVSLLIAGHSRCSRIIIKRIIILWCSGVAR